MKDKIKIGISSCLLGQKIRYDGGHKLDLYLRDTLGQYLEWVPVCPEVESGLQVPREAMRLVGLPVSPRLVTVYTEKDFTAVMLSWAKKKLDELATEGLCGFVFKSGSPSSGMRGVTVYTPAGEVAGSGAGIFAAAFMKRFPLLPVEEDERLHDPAHCKNFLERVLVFRKSIFPCSPFSCQFPDSFHPLTDR